MCSLCVTLGAPVVRCVPVHVSGRLAMHSGKNVHNLHSAFDLCEDSGNKCTATGDYTLGGARTFFALTSKITPLGAMLKYHRVSPNVKSAKRENTSVCSRCAKVPSLTC